MYTYMYTQCTYIYIHIWLRFGIETHKIIAWSTGDVQGLWVKDESGRRDNERRGRHEGSYGFCVSIHIHTYMSHTYLCLCIHINRYKRHIVCIIYQGTEKKKMLYISWFLQIKKKCTFDVFYWSFSIYVCITMYKYICILIICMDRSLDK